MSWRKVGMSMERMPAINWAMERKTLVRLTAKPGWEESVLNWRFCQNCYFHFFLYHFHCRDLSRLIRSKVKRTYHNSQTLPTINNTKAIKKAHKENCRISRQPRRQVCQNGENKRCDDL